MAKAPVGSSGGSTAYASEGMLPSRERGKASVSDATPLRSDRSDPARRVLRTLARRNRTRASLTRVGHVPL